MAQLEGKTVLITGATRGIGLAAAIGIAKEKPELVLVGRDAQRTHEAVERVKRESGNDRVTSLLCDLSSFAAVRKLADEFKSSHRQLQVLVNNAGGLFGRRELTADGYERTFALNHLSPFLLTQLLRDLLVASAPARVVTTSSGAHFGGRINFDDLMSARHFRAFRAYSNSKLANVLFTRELARRLEGTKVTANCFHPGFVASGFGHNNGGLWSIAMTLGRPFARTPEQGAKTAIYLATSPDVVSVTGKYFSDGREADTSAAGRDMEAARRLWEVSESLTRPQASPARVA